MSQERKADDLVIRTYECNALSRELRSQIGKINRKKYDAILIILVYAILILLENVVQRTVALNKKQEKILIAIDKNLLAYV